MDRDTTVYTNLKYSPELDGSRISFGIIRYSLKTRIKRGLRFLFGLNYTHVLGSYSETKNLMIYYAQNNLDTKEIAKVISHEFLHMVLSSHSLETVGLDNFLRKTGNYDLRKLNNGGI